ncbi:MAG: DUF4157 domain-containing protein [Alphaproteobacteria bacterium]
MTKKSPMRPLAWAVPLALALGLALSGAARADDGAMGKAQDALGELSGLLDSLSKALPEAERVAASSLAQAISDTRDRAAPQAQAMPDDIKVDLAPFFASTPWLLDKVRWVVGDRIGGMTDLVMLNPDVTAVALDHVVVFRNEVDARTNREMWAHELVHVLQYETLGVEGFAQEYLRSGGSALEKEAEAFEDHVRQKLAGRKPTLT